MVVIVMIDHYMIMARMRVKIKWDLGRRNDVMEDERVVSSDRIQENRCKEEYERKLSEILREERLGVGSPQQRPRRVNIIVE